MNLPSEGAHIREEAVKVDLRLSTVVRVVIFVGQFLVVVHGCLIFTFDLILMCHSPEQRKINHVNDEKLVDNLTILSPFLFLI